MLIISLQYPDTVKIAVYPPTNAYDYEASAGAYTDCKNMHVMNIKFATLYRYRSNITRPKSCRRAVNLTCVGARRPVEGSLF